MVLPLFERVSVKYTSLRNTSMTTMPQYGRKSDELGGTKLNLRHFLRNKWNFGHVVVIT